MMCLHHLIHHPDAILQNNHPKNHEQCKRNLHVCGYVQKILYSKHNVITVLVHCYIKRKRKGSY